MNRLIDFFAKKGVFADLLTAAVILVGIFSMMMIQREVFPNVNFDVVTINTIFPGASAEEVEKLITNPLEQDLKEVDGIKRMTSISREGRSSITIKLDPDETTQTEGEADIQDVVDRFTDLPDGAEDPIVLAMESKNQPIVEVAISGDFTPMELRKEADKIESELERLPGVARIIKNGYRDLEIRVEADPKKLSTYQLSLDDVVGALAAQNLSIPGGVVESNSQGKTTESIVRTIGEFETTADVEKTVVRANDIGQSTQIKDIARTSLQLEKPEVYLRTNGSPSISLTVLKKEKADAISIVDEVKKKMKELEPTISKGLKYEFINDNSFFIRRRLKILSNNLLVGLILVLVVLSLILPFRVALLVAVGIPFAFLGTMILFYNNGISLNMISLMGLIIVVGMLVDDAIVVMENAVRLMEEGYSPMDAAILGTQQVWKPVTASVLTTVLAFAPMLIMTGIMGKFIMYLPLGVILALLISLIEVYFVLPHHISSWITFKKRTKEDSKTIMGRILTTTETFWENKIVPTYERYLAFAIRRRYLIGGGAFALFIGTLVMAGSLMRFVLFPPDGIEIFFIRTQSPPGTGIDITEQRIHEIEDVVFRLPKEELDNFTTQVGLIRQDSFDPNVKRGGEYAQIVVYLTPESNRTRTAKEIIEDLRVKIGTPPGFTRITFDRVNPGPPVGKPISVGIKGKDYRVIMPAVEDLKKVISKLKGVSDVNDTYVQGKNEYRIMVNSAEAAAAGLNVSSIGNTVRAAYEGIIATTIRKLDEEIDVRVSLPKEARSSAKALHSIKIPNRLGNLVPLSQISKIEQATGVSLYQHEENTRQVRIEADVDVNVTSAVESMNSIRKMKTDFEKNHPGVTMNFGGGEEEDTQESMQSLGRAFLLAAMGIFLILVATFNQIFQPILILLTIPLGIMSVIWTFFVHGLPLSFMGMLGTIALGGVIVNNAIVFMDFVNSNREAGKDRFESIRMAASQRIRPIFLTTMTTVCGLLPTAYGIGGKDPFVVPVALSLGWGMFFGSILTLFVFPAALSIMDDLVEWTKSKFQKNKREESL
ncbi:MAG: MFS transporter [Bdellovibrionaceae bacterium]|nr:MFS transporter [Pseudobdellovibrionaceae bacterium]|tara:strand:+ start:28 stop:3183 length:3156 start_codon:yes stop_codon:yes gene_type:complete